MSQAEFKDRSNPAVSGKSFWVRHVRLLGAVYIVLLIASILVQHRTGHSPASSEGGGRNSVLIGAQPPDAAADPVTVSYLAFGKPRGDQPPVILLHGSPGQANNFDALGPELARLGRRSFALDMPGFGASTAWVPDYSARAYAGYVLAFMDAMDIERAHIVGWSNGGAVALNTIDLEADRVASLTLLASIACQETEGSGDFYFEHAKYAVGYGAAVVLPELIPHFGLLGPRTTRHAFIRNFWDTDQRPIRAIMESLETPTLILHGRHDPLVSDWAAQRHHELIPTSRLIMTGHSHFMPFMQAPETAGYLDDFFDHHDGAGVAPLTDAVILEPQAGRAWFRSMLERVRGLPWPFAAALCAIGALLRRYPATSIAGLLVGHGVIDFGVATGGLIAGLSLAQNKRCACAPRRTLRSIFGSGVGSVLWTAASLLIAQILLSSGTGIGELSPAVVAGWVLGVACALWLLALLPTRARRRRLVASLRRPLHHEWWPSGMLYAALLPHFLRLALRHRSLTVWTCVNPGIHPGGGVMGESKVEILNGLDQSCALTQVTIGPITDSANPGDRLAGVERKIESDPALSYPVVVKPESGERGDRVSIVRTPADLRTALGAIPEPAIVQRYHPGPIELGVFWVRDQSTIGDERTDTTQGSILGVTRKVFPELHCDGVRTIREQILAHKRYRMQAGVYCAHLRDRLGAVPPAGTRLRLTDIGNHAKGCRFKDGSDLITPELAKAIDRLARTWRGPNGEPFDYGRFDIRSVSDDAVRAGADLAVIELNGVTSEATNLYDPSWSPGRALRLLARQWSIAFELGALRRERGARPLGLIGLVRVLRSSVVHTGSDM